MNPYKRFSKFIPLWIEQLEAEGRTEKTRQTYQDRIMLYFKQDSPLKQYLALRRKQVKSRTYNLQENTINMFFQWLLVTGRISKHPDPNYKPTKRRIKAKEN